MQQTPWFRTTAWLGTSVGIWAVLFTLDLWLLIADPTRRQQHVLLLPAPLVLGGLAVGRLRAALRARAALQRQSLDDGDRAGPRPEQPAHPCGRGGSSARRIRRRRGAGRMVR